MLNSIIDSKKNPFPHFKFTSYSIVRLASELGKKSIKCEKKILTV